MFRNSFVCTKFVNLAREFREKMGKKLVSRGVTTFHSESKINWPLKYRGIHKLST